MAREKLGEYSAKRKFEATPEPAPALPQARSGPLLFVIQQHAARRLHYDFRLECDGVLKSWAVPKGPSLDPADKRLAVQTEDHPYEYASFEGVIPRGQYGAGQVIVWDCGVYSPDEGGETRFHDRAQAERLTREALDKGKLSLLLRGEKVKGSFALVRGADRKNWLLIKHKDRFAAQADVTAHDRSVLSGMSLGSVRSHPAPRFAASRLVPGGEAEALPATLAPMHAESGDAAFDDLRWMWEPKLDGYRVLAFIEGTTVKLHSRRGLDLAAAFPGLAAELAKQSPGTMILDGELVALDASGRPSFNALQKRVQLKSARDISAAERNAPAIYYCFDLLHFAGVNLRHAPYSDRRRYLSQCLLPSPHVQLVHASEDGRALHEAALASGFEGVVAKRRTAATKPDGARRHG
jgi:bifunctional non-homologous end joining protein LigD